MIGEIMTADEALDAVGKGRTLVCFARQDEVATVARLIDRHSQVMRLKVVRVEPTVEAALVFQLPKRPTFILYENGAERWQAIGTEELAQAFEKTPR